MKKCLKHATWAKKVIRKNGFVDLDHFLGTFKRTCDKYGEEITGVKLKTPTILTVMLLIFTDLLKSFTGSSGKGQGAKKAKRAAKVETGTVESNGEEWLQGTFAAPKKNK